MSLTNIDAGDMFKSVFNGKKVIVVVDGLNSTLSAVNPLVSFHRESEEPKARSLSFAMFKEVYEPLYASPEVELPEVKLPEVKPLEVNPKYDRKIIGKDGNNCIADVYRVLDAFDVTNPMLQHLAKKALCAGLRGHKNIIEDLEDIKTAINAAILFEQQKESNTNA